MKKIFTIIIASLLSFGTELNAQDAYPQEGDLLIHAGVGVGGFGLIGFGSWPMLGITGEYIILNDLAGAGIGSLGIGATVAFKRYRPNLFDNFAFTRYFFAPRALVHFDVGGDELDLYAGVQIGFGVWIDSTSEGFEAPTGLSVVPGIVAGANYYFNDRFGAFGEISVSLSRINAGFAFKL